MSIIKRYYYHKKFEDFLNKNMLWIFIDYFILKIYYFFKEDTKDITKTFFLYKTSENISNFRSNYRINQTSWSFYLNNYFYKYKDNYQNLFNKTFFALSSVWRSLRLWIIGLILSCCIGYYLMVVRLLPFNKVLFEWLLITMFIYWLISGFVFFVKKYKYSKFTSVIQRFWKRTYILFWLIESGVFIVFFYLTLNASDEPVYMYDQIKIYKTHLFSWRVFLLKLIPITTLIILGYYLQLSLRWHTFSKQSPLLLIITLVLLYIVWLEFYQFFHIINFYGNIIWTFDYDELLWNLDTDFRRTRLANNYVTVCLLAKFWHLIFIFVFWVFFVLRINEVGRVRYLLLSANLQNFIILYIMSWLYMYPWLKFLFRKQLDITYYWFFVNARDLGLRIFFNDLKLYFYGIQNLFSNLFSFNTYNFYYWIEATSQVGFNGYKKHVIRDNIIGNLINLPNLNYYYYYF